MQHRRVITAVRWRPIEGNEMHSTETHRGDTVTLAFAADRLRIEVGEVEIQMHLPQGMRLCRAEGAGHDAGH